MDIYELNFMHPQYGTIFTAEVDVSFTADEMLRNLLLTGFIPERAKGYRLALMEEVLRGDQPIAELSELYDGAVFRIIPNIQELGATQEAVVETPITLYIRHPHSAEYAPFQVLPSTTGHAMLELLELRGFLKEGSDGLALLFKGEVLDLDAPIGSQQLPAQAYLELQDPDAQAADQVLRNLLLGLDSLQQRTDQKLEAIIKQMPPPSAIPIDPQRAISPTADIYEGVDTLLTQIRSDADLPPSKKIRIYSPIPTIFWISTMLIGLTLLILLSLDLL